MDEGLKIRKVPDKSEGERIVRFDPDTGEKKLVNPATEGEEHEAWPLLGVRIENEEPPRYCEMSTGYVAAARSAGWMEATGEKVVHKPAGPAENPWANTHTFVQLKTITIKTLDGDVRYNVVHNPDKYDDETGEPTDNAGDPTTHVDWFYGLELAS